MLNEVHEQVGAPTNQCMDPFSLRVMLESATASITVINVSIPDFKDISASFLDLSLIMEGFFIVLSEYFIGKD